MIQPYDLMIGNIVQYKNALLTVISINQNYINAKESFDLFKYEELKPIRLTQQWLLGFGFIETPFNDYTIRYNCSDFYVYWNTNFNKLAGTKNILYVHQLQNFYYTNERVRLFSDVI